MVINEPPPNCFVINVFTCACVASLIIFIYLSILSPSTNAYVSEHRPFYAECHLGNMKIRLLEIWRTSLSFNIVCPEYPGFNNRKVTGAWWRIYALVIFSGFVHDVCLSPSHYMSERWRGFDRVIRNTFRLNLRQNYLNFRKCVIARGPDKPLVHHPITTRNYDFSKA